MPCFVAISSDQSRVACLHRNCLITLRQHVACRPRVLDCFRFVGPSACSISKCLVVLSDTLYQGQGSANRAAQTLILQVLLDDCQNSSAAWWLAAPSRISSIRLRPFVPILLCSGSNASRNGRNRRMAALAVFHSQGVATTYCRSQRHLLRTILRENNYLLPSAPKSSSACFSAQACKHCARAVLR